MARRPTVALAALALALGTSACLTLDYDLAGVPVPVSAKPEPPGAAVAEPFRIEGRNVLWLDGLAGHSQPDVAALVTERAAGYDRIADFRVSQETNIHHWLLTHLTLSLVRMRRVVIEGVLVRDAR